MIAESILQTPIGPLVLAHEGGVLLKAHFGAAEGAEGPCPAAIANPLVSYFAGDAAALTRVPIRLDGTEFEEKVWRALLRIPAGTTCTYKDIALELGGRRYSHAVGNAVGRNRIAVVVPCHRVIGSDGGMTGYAWGLGRKEWLLAHEGWRAREPELF